MTPDRIAQLDPIIHSRVRLAVLSILVSVKDASFTYLKETIGTTDGNLSVSLSKLEEAGYIAVKKSFKGKKPLTTCTATAKGKKAFSEYLKALAGILNFKGEEGRGASVSDRRS
jgi:DNA-binding MarR family transcriptional regulator